MELGHGSDDDIIVASGPARQQGRMAAGGRQSQRHSDGRQPRRRGRSAFGDEGPLVLVALVGAVDHPWARTPALRLARDFVGALRGALRQKAGAELNMVLQTSGGQPICIFGLAVVQAWRWRGLRSDHDGGAHPGGDALCVALPSVLRACHRRAAMLGHYEIPLEAAARFEEPIVLDRDVAGQVITGRPAAM